MDSFVQLSKVFEIVGEIFELGSLPMTGRVKIQYVTKEKREIRSQEDLEEAIIYYEEKKLAFLNLFCTIQSPTPKPQDQQQQHHIKTNLMPARHVQQPFVDPPSMQQASMEQRRTLATMPLKTKAQPETRQMTLNSDKDRSYNNTNLTTASASSEQKTRKVINKKISPNIAPNTNLEPIDESGGAKSFEYSENVHHQTQATGYLSNHVFGYNPNMTHRTNNHYSNPMQTNHPSQQSLQTYNYNNFNHHHQVSGGGRGNEIERFHHIMPHEPAPLLVARPTHPFNYFSSDGDFVVTHQQPRTFNNIRSASEALMTTTGSSLTSSTIKSSRNSYLDLFEKRMQVMEAARQKIQQKVLDRHLKYQ